MDEIWKNIAGYNGFYQVSNLGRVKSTGGWRGNCLRKEKIRKLGKTKDGYLKVRLLYRGKDVTASVHRLVAEAFIPRIKGKDTVNHIDGNKENNHVDNLEWADRTEQLNHAYRLNLKVARRGIDNCNSKLTIDEIRAIRKEYKPYTRGRSTVALAKKYGVTDRVIGLVVNNRSYKNVK